MQVEMERLPNAVAKISVTIESDAVRGAMNKAFRKVVGNYNIPGFRRGKAPRGIFERFVGRDVLLQTAAEDLVEDHYLPALAEAKVEPVAEPKIDIVTLSETDPFEFSIQVEAKPEFDLGDYAELLTIPLEVPQVTAERLEEELQSAANTQAQLEPADAEPVASGNRVTVKLKGFLEPEEGSDQEPELFAEEDAYPIDIGSGNVTEELETQLIGAKVGEPLEIRFTYPTDHPDVELSGKPVRFEVEVLENKKRVVPAVDEELAKTLGYESLQELKETLENRLAERLAQEAKDARLNEILGKLREQVTFEIPPSLIEQAAHQQLHEVENSLSRMGITLEQYLESRQLGAAELTEEFKPQAAERVKNRLLLEKVAEERGFSVSDEEVIEAIRPVAEMYKQPLSDLVQLFRRQGDFEAVRGNLLISKASDYLATTVTGGSEEENGSSKEASS